MKVLFLDIDGVLNHETTKPKFLTEKYPWARGLDDVLLDRYLKWIEGKPITVVLSSMWRYHDDLMEVLKAHGVNFSDITEPGAGWPLSQSFSRGAEIANYMQDHPEIDEYAILDDIQWFFDYQQNHLVLTNPDIGLTDEDLIQVQKILDLEGAYTN